MGRVFFFSAREDFAKEAKRRFEAECFGYVNRAIDILQSQKEFLEGDRRRMSMCGPPPAAKLRAIRSMLEAPNYRNDPQKRQHVFNIEAGTLLFDQVRQVSQWLAYYSVAPSPIVAGEMDRFPTLNISEQYGEDYVTITERCYPLEIQRAVNLGALAYGLVEEKNRLLRGGGSVQATSLEECREQRAHALRW